MSDRLFQSTRPRGAGRIAITISVNPIIFQSTRLEHCIGREQLISIHPPARGGTLGVVIVSSALQFQSTRPRGAGPVHVGPPPHPAQFQSTRPRGTGLPRCQSGTDGRRFQSTRPRGAGPTAAVLGMAHFGFQSTRPRGAGP